jgi:hypothetical protein
VPNGLEEDFALGVRYEGGNSTNYIAVGVRDDNPVDSTRTCYAEYDSGGHTTSSSWDANFYIYISP